MLLTQRLNTYFAILLVTIFGGAATLLIVRIAHTDAEALVTHDEAQYRNLLR